MDECYRTLKGYEMITEKNVTSSMEDYLEMIFRLTSEAGVDAVRVGEVAEKLSVRPSSASKMIGNLKQRGMVRYEKYGIVSLTESGRSEAQNLMKRHQILHSFFCYINGTENELELVERTEHFFDMRTVENIDVLIKRLKGTEGNDITEQ